jgi:hypothetical protein
MNYTAYIKSRPWREKRVAVLRRAGGVCERCGKWPVVNVHHLTYVRLGGELPADLIGVCFKCHQEIHRDATA